MIKDSKTISIAEAKEFIQEDKDLEKFIDKFTELTSEEGKSLREKLEGLNILKLNEKNISMIISCLPEDNEDLNKIFTDMSLDEDESKKILETIKEFK